MKQSPVRVESGNTRLTPTQGVTRAVEKRKEPRYAPGQELTLHPGDPVRGAELLVDEPGKENSARGETPEGANRPTPDRYY